MARFTQQRSIQELLEKADEDIRQQEFNLEQLKNTHKKESEQRQLEYETCNSDFEIMSQMIVENGKRVEDILEKKHKQRDAPRVVTAELINAINATKIKLADNKKQLELAEMQKAKYVKKFDDIKLLFSRDAKMNPYFREIAEKLGINFTVQTNENGQSMYDVEFPKNRRHVHGKLTELSKRVPHP